MLRHALKEIGATVLN